MFTGLIEEVGLLRRISRDNAGAHLLIEAETVLSDLKIGDSIAVSGPCLTVTSLQSGAFTAFAMSETLEKTTLGFLASAERVNLERALTLQERLGGHLVSGHIDQVVTLAGRRSEGAAVILTIEAPAALLRYIVPKGSVALDGVSLTVIDLVDQGFAVGLIPHTSEQTTLGRIRPGSRLNLEVDLIGKYVEKMLKPRLEQESPKNEAITMSLLREKGYL